MLAKNREWLRLFYLLSRLLALLQLGSSPGEDGSDTREAGGRRRPLCGSYGQGSGLHPAVFHIFFFFF